MVHQTSALLVLCLCGSSVVVVVSLSSEVCSGVLRLRFLLQHSHLFVSGSSSLHVSSCRCLQAEEDEWRSDVLMRFQLLFES